jgi:hypothetical protein
MGRFKMGNDKIRGVELYTLYLLTNLQLILLSSDVLMVVKGRKQREVKSAGEVEDEINGASGADALSNLSPEEYKKAMENASPEDMQKAMKV